MKSALCTHTGLYPTPFFFIYTHFAPPTLELISKWKPADLFEADHHLTREFHVFEHTLQLTGEVCSTLWGGERERRRREGGRVCVCQGSPMLSASFSVSCLARSKVETHPQSYRKLSRFKGQTVQICKTKLNMGPTSQTTTLIPSAKDKSDQTRGERERRK